MTDTHINLRSHILIAMPSLHGDSFNKSITLICEHSDADGAMGIVLNQPTPINSLELLNQLDIPSDADDLAQQPVYAGGPVQTDCGFVLHDSNTDWDATIQVNDEIRLTSSNHILHELAKGRYPKNFRIALGYAGWAPGQLEAEIKSNAWLTINYQKELVFNTPADQQWLNAGHILGIDLNLLTSGAGHA